MHLELGLSNQILGKQARYYGIFEIPTDGDQRSKSSKFLCHWSQREFLDFVIFPKRGCLRLFAPVLPSFEHSKWGLSQFGPTQRGCGTLYFSSSHPIFWVLGFDASVNILMVMTVIRKWDIAKKCSVDNLHLLHIDSQCIPLATSTQSGQCIYSHPKHLFPIDIQCILYPTSPPLWQSVYPSWYISILTVSAFPMIYLLHIGSQCIPIIHSFHIDSQCIPLHPPPPYLQSVFPRHTSPPYWQSVYSLWYISSILTVSVSMWYISSIMTVSASLSYISSILTFSVSILVLLFSLFADSK